MIDKREEIKVGDRILILDLFLQEKRELLSDVIDIRYIPGRRTYLVETQSGDSKLAGDHQILRNEYSE